MCILLNVKKHEKTFALNVDIFRKQIISVKFLTRTIISYKMNLNAMTKTVGYL